MLRYQRQNGFTLIELLVVVLVIALLASLTYYFITTWRSEAAITEVKNDLGNAQGSLTNYRNFNGAYPGSLSSIYTNTDTVTLTYTLRSDGTYCLNGVSTVDSAVQWYVDTRVSGGVASGSCTP